MRKVHERAITLLRLGVAGKPGPHDEVVSINETDAEGWTESVKVWKYYGSVIAKVYSNGKVFVNWRGYFTASTSLRIYALFDYYGLERPKKQEGWVEVGAAARKAV